MKISCQKHKSGYIALIAFSSFFVTSSTYGQEDVCKRSIKLGHGQMAFQVSTCTHSNIAKCMSANGYKLSGTATVFDGRGYALTAAHNVRQPTSELQDCPLEMTLPLPDGSMPEREQRCMGTYGTYHDDHKSLLSRRMLVLSAKRILQNGRWDRNSAPRMFFALEISRTYLQGPDLSLLAVLSGDAVELQAKELFADFDPGKFWSGFGMDRGIEQYDRNLEQFKRRVSAINPYGLVLYTNTHIGRGFPEPPRYAAWTFGTATQQRATQQGLGRLDIALDDHHVPACVRAIEKFADHRWLRANIDHGDFRAITIQQVMDGMSGASLRGEGGFEGAANLYGVFRGIPACEHGSLTPAECYGVDENRGVGEYHVFSSRLTWPVLLSVPKTRELPEFGSREFVPLMRDILSQDSIDALHLAFSMVDSDSQERFISETRGCISELPVEDTRIQCIDLSDEVVIAVRAYLDRKLQDASGEVSKQDGGIRALADDVRNRFDGKVVGAIERRRIFLDIATNLEEVSDDWEEQFN